MYSQCHVEGQYVAMTFDDGPHATNTPRLLDMLKQRKIHATFFVVGQCAAEFPDIMKRIVAEGHEIGNHTLTHKDRAYQTPAGTRKQLAEAKQKIDELSGQDTRLFRPPRGVLTGDAADIAAKTQALVQASMKIGESLYGAAGPGGDADEGGSASAGSDGVVDAEFEEVDGHNKKSA